MRNTFEVLASPVKSPNDKKEYKVIKLQNGLVACLIADTAPVKCDDFSGSEDESGSDNEESKLKVESEVDFAKNKNEADDAPMKKVSDVEQKMAAAALCVNVGSLSDPKDIPGLAHFLEHMVFMGSEKYPGENDFNSFIKKRGGSDNASTDYETTVFYFDCLKKHLFKALDRFAQFFIAPLMRESSMTREREAVESEFQIILPNDSYREAQLLCSLAKPDSPVNSFLWGNLITLRDNVTDEKLHADLHDFRKRHYSAHRMTVAIQAQLPMEKLQGFVLDCFSGISNNNQPPDDFKKYENSVFDTPQFSKLYYIKPQLDVCQLYLTWYLPSLLKKYKTKAFSYVAWLIGDEGKGSLLSHLKKKLWALALSAGNSRTGMEHNSIYHQFSVKLVLTPDGLAHIVDVITAVFSYINLLKTVGPQERIFKELQNIEDVSFKFAAEPEPVDYVEGIAQAMHFYPPEDYIIGSKLYFEYNPEVITSFHIHNQK
ncbi:hypothetical protein HHI36_007014 [Cryptolaemus montrouzieri]|uniref:Nardilysin n=1 Tax=Cryptolaemus montrouzieri TaxID=559131 RepID=A0ABD2MN72_9CUCU